MAETHRDEIAKLEALYENNPEGRVFTHLAEAYRKAGELDRARETVERGLVRHPDYSSAHVVLARVLSDQGREDEAARAFDRVLELDRHNLIALRFLAGHRADLGDTTGALHFYRELLALDPVDDRLRVTVARLEEQQALTQTATPAESVEQAISADVTAGPDTEVDSSEGVDPWQQQEAAAFDDTGSAAASGTDAVSDAIPAQNAERSAEAVDSDAPMDGREAAAEPAGFVSFSEYAARVDAEPAASEESSQPADWENALAGDEPALPGDVSRFGPSVEAGSKPDQPVEFYDFRANAIDEQSWSASWRAGDAASRDETDQGRRRSDTEARVHGHEAAASPPPEQAADSEDDRAAVADASAPAEGGDDEVVTETLAQLYGAQGFHERAADVYRALLRDRPDDAQLHDRLRQAERAAGIGEPDDETGGPGDDGEWAETVESAWTGGGGVAGVDPTPYAWTDRVAEEATGGPVRSYLRDLLSWRPAGGTETAVHSAAASESGGLEAEEVAAELVLTEEAIIEAEAPGQDAEDVAWHDRVENAAPEAEADEDADLEMFRSWLQSLKK